MDFTLSPSNGFAVTGFGIPSRAKNFCRILARARVSV